MARNFERVQQSLVIAYQKLFKAFENTGVETIRNRFLITECHYFFPGHPVKTLKRNANEKFRQKSKQLTVKGPQIAGIFIAKLDEFVA